MIHKTVTNLRNEEICGWGSKPALELDMLQKLYYLRKGNEIFLHTFCLLICRLNANTTA